MHQCNKRTGKTFPALSLTSFAATLLTLLSAAPAFANTIDDKINAVISPISNTIAGIIFFSLPVNGTAVPLILVWLVIAAIVFTLYFGFLQFRVLGHAFQLVRGKFKDPSAPGQVTHFEALSTALSGTVGLGNIAGVAVAVSLGGAGATFWMILAGLMGMATKFCECTLGVKYRNEYADGRVSGGPMYYLSKGFEEKGMGVIGRFLAILFAIACIGGCLGAGNMFQANQSFQQVLNVTGGENSPLYGQGWLFGLIMAVVVGMVIIGGIKSIASTTSKVVPIMTFIYIGSALLVLVMNYDKIGDAFLQIYDGAFSPEGITGGFIGVLIQGFRRAAFSNEAGFGSAAIAHSAVQTNEPVSEGLVSLLEPLIDTVIICTMTALVIIITGQLGTDAVGVQLTSNAFGSVFSWFPYVLALAVVLFAFSTMISWAYYGLKAWTYLFGEGQITEFIFKIIFCLTVIGGASMNLSAVIDFSDAMVFTMALINIIGLYVLMSVVKKELKSYLKRLNSGEIKPTH